ncbi:MAG: Unknown protein [uncultured Aureispira sp.]|uniref:DUF547 domain-containing protein n=1 Tax=uncultured Aureispira sp. TaxID=1331704 RepID=A0A6S6SJ54_9BACT|nr:MAG: Unknown protein [uncultured Aureispira sp.]
MKQLILFFIFFLLTTWSAKAQKMATFIEQSDSFFLTYAQHNSVQYKVLHQNPTELNALVEQIAAINLSSHDEPTQKAFFINAYNLLVIHTVVANYPIASPNEVVTFWDEMEQNVAGKKYSLGALKAQILETFQDPLLHFVLVDGSMGSAQIVPFAYQAAYLDTQLEDRAIAFMNAAKYIKYNEEVNEIILPRLFKNNRLDFGTSMIDFLNKYRVKKLNEATVLKYSNYDWRLNAYYNNTSTVLKKKHKKTGYSPSAQVITLPKNSVELMVFNSLYSVNYGEKELGSRNSYYNGYFSAFYGVTGKLDIGATFLLRSTRENDPFNSSPFKALEFERTPLNTNSGTSGAYADWGLSHVGLSIRFAPFKNLNLSFEQGVMLPIQNLPKENTVDNSLYSVTQVYYSHSFSAKTQLFLALTFWQPIRPGEPFKFQPPLLKGFLNYFVTPRFTVFATTMYFLEWGVGVKYMLTPKLEIQGMYSYYVPIPGIYDIVSPGANTIMTYNLGLRYRL